VPGSIRATPRLRHRADLDDVRALAEGGDPVLLDARRPGSYDGSVEELPGRAGHIPSARSLPALDLYDDAGHLRSDDELRALFAAVGVEPGDAVVAYCHIGLWASAVVHAARTLGIEARLYDGSMTEWAADPELPLARPDEGPGGGRRP
jgi:thiosulfate/3-mercaptopyruvate sulfurtransferase